MLLFLGVYFGNSSVGWGQTYTVISDEIWSTTNPPPTGYNGGIAINSGQTLTINGISLYMNLSTNIIMNPGSHLILNNSTIGGSNGDTWYGIFIEGDANENQFATLPNPSKLNSIPDFKGLLNPNQTSVELNNSTLRNAFRALESFYGGIIRSENSIFYDNVYSIIFNKYSDPTNDNINASYIINSNFFWSSSNFSFAKMIQLLDVSGIYIGGIKIDNFYSNLSCNRGTGIYAENSNFTLAAGGNVFLKEGDATVIGDGTQRNTFEKLSFGVKSLKVLRFNASGSSLNENTDYNCVIRKSDFIDNFYSIHIKEGTNCKIANNTFSSEILNNQIYFGQTPFFLTCHNFDKITDITLDYNTRNNNNVGTRGTKIYDNSFKYDSYLDNTLTPITRGIVHILSNGNDNWYTLIQKNTFTNTNANNIIALNQVTGIEMIGGNLGTEMLCNVFNNIGTSIKVGGLATVKNQQGNPWKAAFNTFPPQFLQRLRFDNSGGSIINYYLLPSEFGSLNDPLTNPFIQLSMGLNRISTNSEVPNCELTYDKFLTSIKDINQIKPSLISFPQPSNLGFNLKILNSKYIYNSYEIFDVNGKLLTSKIIDSNIEDLFISTKEIANGIYLLKLNSNTNFIAQKIIVNH